MTSEIVVAMTGASGALYSVRLLEVLLAAGNSVQLVISPAATQVFQKELGLTVDLNEFSPSQLVPAERQGDQNSVFDRLRPAASRTGQSFVPDDPASSLGRLTYQRLPIFPPGSPADRSSRRGW